MACRAFNSCASKTLHALKIDGLAQTNFEAAHNYSVSIKCDETFESESPGALHCVDQTRQSPAIHMANENFHMELVLIIRKTFGIGAVTTTRMSGSNGVARRKIWIVLGLDPEDTWNL